MRTTSSRDNWVRLVEAVIKREQIWQLFHQDSITTVGSDITQRDLSLRPVPSSSSRLPLTTDSVVPERRESQTPLKWETRLRIARGVARGLDYLHHGCIRGIIHRDVKAENVWLDEDFEGVVSDFSLAIFTDSIDHVMRGTIGHIAPEYLSTGKCSSKTDVYGYGMFLLELITAQQGFDLARLAKDDDMMLLDWVNKLFEEKKFKIIVDRHLEGNFVEEEVEKLFQIVLICTQTDPERRPTMSEIVRMLEYGDGLGEAWEEFSQNVYFSKLLRRADWSNEWFGQFWQQ